MHLEPVVRALAHYREVNVRVRIRFPCRVTSDECDRLSAPIGKRPGELLRDQLRGDGRMRLPHTATVTVVGRGAPSLRSRR